MDALNLSPQERRLVAGVGLVVFIFLNIWLVWPHFSDWRNIQTERERSERTLARYQTEVNQLPKYQTKLDELEASGSSVVAQEQDLNLATVVTDHSQRHKVQVNSRIEVPSSGFQTNQFFDEKGVRIDFTAGMEELVTFLESLTPKNVRVRELNISPDPPNAPQRLRGRIDLVASYQRKPPAPAPVATNSAVAARPVISPAVAKSNVAASKVASAAPGPTNKTTATLPPPLKATPTASTNLTLPKRVATPAKQ